MRHALLLAARPHVHPAPEAPADPGGLPMIVWVVAVCGLLLLAAAVLADRRM
jgi:hypothetical protein